MFPSAVCSLITEPDLFMFPFRYSEYWNEILKRLSPGIRGRDHTVYVACMGGVKN
jgi:hypothetical protein